MIIDGKDLKRARDHMDLKQEQVAERLHVGLSTYQRWEQNKQRPHPEQREALLAFFKQAFRELDIQVFSPTAVTLPQPSHAPSVPKNSVVTFAESDLGTRLLFLVTPTYTGYDDMHRRMEGILKDIGAMNEATKNDQITRRDALTRVVALPIGALQLKAPGQIVPSGLYGVALSTCAAGIAGSWELLKSSEAGDLATAFDGVSLYLPVLADIVQYSAHYRKKASELAARCAIVKTILCWHCSDDVAARHCAQQALDYSKEAGDISLQLSASSKLAWAYLYEDVKKHPLALRTALEAKSVLDKAEKRGIPIPPAIHDGIHSTLALMQVMNKQNCDSALGKAGELDPGWECPAFMQFTRTDLELEAGMIYLHKGDQGKAMGCFQKIVDPKELILKDAQPHSVSWHGGTIIHMAESVLMGKNRDMDEVIRYWTAAMRGARALRSEHFFDEALALYHTMEYIWHGERRIEELFPLTIHWNVEEKGRN
jgi:transcriptional regulator with XRE-family HTH domain